MKITTSERGWVGHFVLGHKCMFRRNTLVSFEEKSIVVSTVGCYRKEDSQGRYGEPEEIGIDRYYETMSFWSDPSDTIYRDADVGRQVYVDAKWSIDKKEMDENPDSIDAIANKMHDEYVNAVKKAIRRGELDEVE